MKLTQVDFQERRDRLAAQMGPNSIAIIATSPVAMRNRDADYKYLSLIHIWRCRRAI